MKHLLLFIMFALTAGITANGQDDKGKIKRTTSATQHVHNTFSRHKKHKGYKVKHTHNHHTRVHKVDVKHEKVKSKED